MYIGSMKKTSLYLCIVLICTSILPLAAQQSSDDVLLSFNELTSILGREDRETLLNDGELTRFHFADFDPLLLPPVGITEALKAKTREVDLNMGIEGLFLYRDFDTQAYLDDPEAMELELYNILRSIRSLEGTMYYSASREEMRELFVESWRIPSLDDPKTVLDDPVVSAIPDKESIFIHQRDRSFGKHESEMTYTYNAPVIWTDITNQTSMYYKSIIRAIKPEQLQIHLVVMPTDEGLLFYGITAAETINMKAFREKASNSFYNRVKALYNWYISSL